MLNKNHKMLLPIICLACALIVSAVERPYEISRAEELFEDFILKYDKVYPTQAEKQMRFEIFKENLNEINRKNAGKTKPVFGITKFTDLTAEEGKAYTGFDPHLAETMRHSCKEVKSDKITSNDAPDDEFNWVTIGAVGPIKNQGNCGSCWAFSTVGNIEGQNFIRNKQLKSFSEQQLVDCSKNNGGCNGGLMTEAMTYLIENGGIQLESSYPYVGAVEACKFDAANIAVRLEGCTNYVTLGEDKLKEVLVNTGPLAVALNGADIQMYSGGIIQKEDCSATINHGVLLVGYGNENGQDYWLLKNSWGENWGEQGYFRMTRGENTCGIDNDYTTSANL